mgnify:CR=1 FL=1
MFGEKEEKHSREKSCGFHREGLKEFRSDRLDREAEKKFIEQAKTNVGDVTAEREAEITNGSTLN